MGFSYEEWLSGKGDYEGHPFRGNQYTEGMGETEAAEAEIDREYPVQAAEFKIKAVINENANIDLSACDSNPAAAQTIAEAVVAYATEFPRAAEHITGFRVTRIEAGNAGLAHPDAASSGFRVTVDDGVYREGWATKIDINEDRVDDPPEVLRTIVDHELGHALDNAVGYPDRPNLRPDTDIGRWVSNYADFSKNSHEVFAELFMRRQSGAPLVRDEPIETPFGRDFPGGSERTQEEVARIAREEMDITVNVATTGVKILLPSNRPPERTCEGYTLDIIRKKGDYEGHPFRGNQWTSGEGQGDNADPLALIDRYAANTFTDQQAARIADAISFRGARAQRSYIEWARDSQEARNVASARIEKATGAKVDLALMHEHIAGVIADRIGRFAEIYPHSAREITAVSVQKGPDGDTPSWYLANSIFPEEPGGGTLGFDEGFVSGPDGDRMLDAFLTAGSDMGDQPMVADAQFMIDHELGHVVADDAEVIKELFLRPPDDLERASVEDSLGQYAAGDPNEAFASAFALMNEGVDLPNNIEAAVYNISDLISQQKRESGDVSKRMCRGFFSDRVLARVRTQHPEWKGDYEGHPFRGNQWTGGAYEDEGGGTYDQESAAQARIQREYEQEAPTPPANIANRVTHGIPQDRPQGELGDLDSRTPAQPPYYHGTTAELNPGDKILPRDTTGERAMTVRTPEEEAARVARGFGSPYDVHLTNRSFNAGSFAANAAGVMSAQGVERDMHVYEVDVSRGAVVMDPEYPGTGFGADQVITGEAVVTREVPWEEYAVTDRRALGMGDVFERAKARNTKGDYEGHPFRGNQWTEGAGGDYTYTGTATHPPEERGVRSIADLTRAALAGGFTYQPFDAATPTRGFAVSPYPQRGRIVDLTTTGRDDAVGHLAAVRTIERELQKFVGDNADLLDRDRHYYGAYVGPDPRDLEAGISEADAGSALMLDVSIVADDKDEAVAIAEHENQQSIFDLGAGDVIETGGTGAAKGDYEGHPFRGNQWTDGESAESSPVGAREGMARIRAVPSDVTKEWRKETAAQRSEIKKQIQAVMPNARINLDGINPKLGYHVGQQLEDLGQRFPFAAGRIEHIVVNSDPLVDLFTGGTTIASWSDREGTLRFNPTFWAGPGAEERMRVANEMADENDMHLYPVQDTTVHEFAHVVDDTASRTGGMVSLMREQIADPKYASSLGTYRHSGLSGESVDDKEIFAEAFALRELGLPLPPEVTDLVDKISARAQPVAVKDAKATASNWTCSGFIPEDMWRKMVAARPDLFDFGQDSSKVDSDYVPKARRAPRQGPESDRDQRSGDRALARPVRTGARPASVPGTRSGSAPDQKLGVADWLGAREWVDFLAGRKPSVITKLELDEWNALIKGDYEGHPFRGNQWTSGEGDGEDRQISPRLQAALNDTITQAAIDVGYDYDKAGREWSREYPDQNAYIGGAPMFWGHNDDMPDMPGGANLALLHEPSEPEHANEDTIQDLQALGSRIESSATAWQDGSGVSYLRDEYESWYLNDRNPEMVYGGSEEVNADRAAFFEAIENAPEHDGDLYREMVLEPGSMTDEHLLDQLTEGAIIPASLGSWTNDQEVASIFGSSDLAAVSSFGPSTIDEEAAQFDEEPYGPIVTDNERMANLTTSVRMTLADGANALPVGLFSDPDTANEYSWQQEYLVGRPLVVTNVERFPAAPFEDVVETFGEPTETPYYTANFINVEVRQATDAEIAAPQQPQRAVA